MSEITSRDNESKPTFPVEQETETSAQTSFRANEKLAKHLNRIKGDIEDLDRDKRLKLFRMMIKSHQYFDGNFYGYVDQNCEWRAKTKEEGEIWYQDNQYYSYIRTALMELSRRQTQLQVNPAFETEELRGAARIAQTRINANRERTFSAHLKQTENTYCLLSGIAFRYTYFEFNRKNGRREKVPQVRKNDQNIEEKKSCANCQTPMDGENCPRCGGTVAQYYKSEGEVVIGYNALASGENKWVSPNPVSILISMQASTVEESPFLKWKQLILRSVLEERYKRRDLPSTGTSTELRYISNQQSAIPADVSAQSYVEETGIEQVEGGELELLELHQTWLDYALYCNLTFDEDQRLSNGKTLKKGTRLGEMFPDGLYFASVGDLIVDLWNEDKNTKWTSSPYSLRAGSCYGAGTTPAHAQQELVNDLKALEMANAWNNSVPKEFVDPQYIEELSLDPAIPTVLSNPIGEGGSILGNAYAQVSPATLSSEVYALEENAKGSMQNQIGALSNSGAGGLSDADQWGNTATAITIRRELAVGRFSPDLELLADNLDKKQAIQFLKNEQNFFTPQQWKQLANKNDREAVEAFISCDIDSDLLITVVPGSYMPKTDAQTISRLMAYAELMGAIAPIGNPELASYAGETFGMPSEITGYTPDKIGALELIERFTALADLSVEQYGDAPNSDFMSNPQILAMAQRISEFSQMPVDVWLDNHDAIIDALKDWRGTDEGRTASNTLTAAVAFRLNEHEGAKVKQAQMMMQRQIEAQAPMKAEQETEEQKQLQLAAGAEEQAAAAQKAEMGMNVLGKVAEISEGEDARNHEAEQMEAERQRDIQVAAIEAQKTTE